MEANIANILSHHRSTQGQRQPEQQRPAAHAYSAIDGCVEKAREPKRQTAGRNDGHGQTTPLGPAASICRAGGLLEPFGYNNQGEGRNEAAARCLRRAAAGRRIGGGARGVLPFNRCSTDARSVAAPERLAVCSLRLARLRRSDGGRWADLGDRPQIRSFPMA